MCLKFHRDASCPERSRRSIPGKLQVHSIRCDSTPIALDLFLCCSCGQKRYEHSAHIPFINAFILFIRNILILAHHLTRITIRHNAIWLIRPSPIIAVIETKLERRNLTVELTFRPTALDKFKLIESTLQRIINLTEHLQASVIDTMEQTIRRCLPWFCRYSVHRSQFSNRLITCILQYFSAKIHIFPHSTIIPPHILCKICTFHSRLCQNSRIQTLFSDHRDFILLIFIIVPVNPQILAECINRVTSILLRPQHRLLRLCCQYHSRQRRAIAHLRTTSCQFVKLIIHYESFHQPYCSKKGYLFRHRYRIRTPRPQNITLRMLPLIQPLIHPCHATREIKCQFINRNPI